VEAPVLLLQSDEIMWKGVAAIVGALSVFVGTWLKGRTHKDTSLLDTYKDVNASQNETWERIIKSMEREIAELRDRVHSLEAMLKDERDGHQKQLAEAQRELAEVRGRLEALENPA
jgi:septal ring factor EnvC (AmiA/AmiB activator)